MEKIMTETATPTTAPTTKLTMNLAAEMIALNELSPQDISQLQLLVLDHVAVTLCGSTQPWGRIAKQWADQYGASGKAVLLGSGACVGASAAGMANGASAHGYELDDTHEKSRSHPGAVVITTALAIGGQTGASGRDIMTAIAAGYEAMSRIGMAANAVEVGEAGFHSTCLFGPFGAAAAAGRLMGFNAEQLAQAWGIALSMTGGASQFAFEPQGTMVKRMHAGIPAHNGIIAAQFASLGMAAPVRAIEGEHGFLHLFSRDPDPAKLTKPTGAPLEIHAMSFKPYSCCRKFHSLIDALSDATDQFSIPPDAISEIHVQSPKGSIEKHMMTRPDSVMAAQYAMPYIVAATLVHGPQHYDAYGPAYHGDTNIHQVIDKIDVAYDQSLDVHMPAAMPNRVTLRLVEGGERKATVIESLGSPQRPMSMEGLIGKARSLAAMTDPDIDIDGLSEAVMTLWRAPDLASLAQHFTLPNYHRSTTDAVN
jgi:2-methylcitrate dehydratase PrpD